MIIVFGGVIITSMIIQKYNYAPIDRTTIDGKRHYCTPDGAKVPSVTTILDRTKPEEKKAALNEWRNRVGHAQAQKITTEAANRGTRMHSYLESYILSDDMKPLPSNPYAHPSWFMAAEVILKGLTNVNEFWGSEVPVYYSGLYAGTTDCIGVWKNKPAIIDFKQSNKVKRKEYISDYFIQLAAYANAHNEVYRTNIRKGVIFMCSADNVYQEFIIEGTEFDEWSNKWFHRLEQYYLL